MTHQKSRRHKLKTVTSLSPSLPEMPVETDWLSAARGCIVGVECGGGGTAPPLPRHGRWYGTGAPPPPHLGLYINVWYVEWGGSTQSKYIVQGEGENYLIFGGHKDNTYFLPYHLNKILNSIYIIYILYYILYVTIYTCCYN